MKVEIGEYTKNDNKERKIEIEIHDYDVWNLDHTLALIIHPALIKLKEVKNSIPAIDKEDIPEHLAHLGPDESGCYFHKELWDWVLDQMIASFDPNEDKWYEPKNNQNVEKGRMLFAKYYGALWD